MVMHSPYLRIGASSVAMVLGQMEDIFQLKGSQDKTSLLPTGQQSDFSVYANFLEENTIILGDTKAEKNVHSCTITINETAKNRFMSILNRVIRAHEGVSRQERIFVHRFWSEIQNSLVLRS